MKRFLFATLVAALAFVAPAHAQYAGPSVGSAAQIWRDYNTDGVPASGAYAPQKSQIRAWAASVENVLAQRALGSGVFGATANYTGGTTGTAFQALVGSSGAPTTSQDAALIVQKWTSSTATTGVNSSVYNSIRKRTTANGSHATAVFNEAQDDVGGNGSFIEGSRDHAVLLVGGVGTAGSASGGVSMGGTAPNVLFQYLIGREFDTENHSGVDALTWGSFTPATFSAAVIATNIIAATGVDNKSDVAFITNPNSVKPYRTGYGCYGNDGAGRIGVDDTCFATKGALQKGLDLSLSTFGVAPILLPNNSPVRAFNAAGNAYHNLLFYDASNQLQIGADATAIVHAAPVVNVSYQRATAFIANGSAPTITGSGSCTISTQTGGATSGTFKATAACAAGQTYVLTGLPGAPTGYSCRMNDQTTSGVVFQQTAATTTGATMTVRTTGVSNNDIIDFACTGS